LSNGQTMLMLLSTQLNSIKLDKTHLLWSKKFLKGQKNSME